MPPLFAPSASAVYQQDQPSKHSFVEWNENPSVVSGTGTATSGTLHVCRLVAQKGGLITNVVYSLAAFGTGMTAATTATISNVANNGSNLCRVTATAHGFSSNDVVTIAGVVGVTAVNAASVITVIDANTFDTTQTFSGTYTSGGTATRSANTIAIYDANGNFLNACGDQVAAWGSTNVKTSALASTFTIAAGSVYYIGFLFNGTASSLSYRILGNSATANANLTGANLRYANGGTTGLTKLPNTITPASLALGTTPMFMALS